MEATALTFVEEASVQSQHKSRQWQQYYQDQSALCPQDQLHYAHIGDLVLESGSLLPQVVLGYQTWGKLNADASNAVLVLHALTADTQVANRQDGSGGWWPQVVGPGCAIDTNRFFVVCPNILGGCYGSTGPHSELPARLGGRGQAWGSKFPLLTVRDTVHAEAILADQLGITRWELVIGGSLGGARAMEWALTYPQQVARCAVLASGPSATAEQLAWAQAQSYAIRLDPLFAGGDYYPGPGPDQGLGLARRIAHTTYRSAPELHFRFGRDAQEQENPLVAQQLGQRGRYRVESYLDHHAAKLVQRFDANSYLVINEILAHHDISRGRASLVEALGLSRCRWLIAAVDSDRLFYPSESEIMAASLPDPIQAQLIRSASGHDGFLLEGEQVSRMVRQFLGADQQLDAQPSIKLVS